MVRRRARTPKVDCQTSSSAGASNNNNNNRFKNGIVTSAAVVNANLLEEQYFASPKRKDCKVDKGGAEIEANNAGMGVKPKPATMGRHKAERSGAAGRVIGVPLATRSQVRTIENFFKASTAAKSAKLTECQEKNTTNSINISPRKSKFSSPIYNSSEASEISLEQHIVNGDEQLSSQASCSPQPSKHQELSNGDLNNLNSQTDYIYVLSEDTNDTENTELSDDVQFVNSTTGCNAFDFSLHRSSLRDSHSSHSSNTENIFLQEPVLTLNVDKTPNQASSIKINKTLEIEPIFSSPPSLTASTLNGRFNKIVSLNGISPTKCDTFGLNGGYILLPDDDNNSCDSGVTLASPLDNKNVALLASQNRRRKPTTPHRIVCPSPIKAAPRKASPADVAKLMPMARKNAILKEQLSPRKSQRYLATVTSKTRRRLNQQREQAPYTTKTIESEQVNHIIEDDDDDVQIIEPDIVVDDLEFENLDENPVVLNDFHSSVVNHHPTLSAKLPINTAEHQQQKSTKNKLKTLTKNSVTLKPPSQQVTQPKIKHQFTQPLAATNGNREVTEFFPVRRSVRKTKTAVKEEMMRDLEKAVLEERAEGLKIAYFEGKGRGIVADRNFKRGEFVVEYIGDLISMTEAEKREQRYAMDKNTGCYMYYFKHKNQQLCIDATVDTGKLGRLVNHSRNGNLITKVVVVKQRPHLILIAKDDIEPGEELTYDYGDRSKLSLIHHPWLAY